MNQLPTPRRLAALVAGTTAVLAATAGASHAVGAPDTLVAATVGVLGFGGASVAAAIRGQKQEAR
ncbi:hypothetical protein [Streptomyces sp. BH104]|uniref:hypothetical protein n=1 Tax=Streptomyces sp. BH104 TaxID=3410407 RepID=UPI003BB60887